MWKGTYSLDSTTFFSGLLWYHLLLFTHKEEIMLNGANVVVPDVRMFYYECRSSVEVPHILEDPVVRSQRVTCTEMEILF